MRVENTGWRIFKNKLSGGFFLVDGGNCNFSRNIKPMSQKEYDNSVIIYYPRNDDFKPVILMKDRVVSGGNYLPHVFYTDLKEVLKLEKGSYTDKTVHWDCERLDDGIYEWGCRDFTKSQLLLIKREMEDFYTKKEL